MDETGEEPFGKKWTKNIISKPKEELVELLKSVYLEKISTLIEDKKLKNIKIGEVFLINDKKYIAGLPKSSKQESDGHGQLVFTLFDI